MGWKLYSIVIRNNVNVSDEQIISRLFETNFDSTGETIFDNCINPRVNSIYFGNYKGNLIISTDVVDVFFTDKISEKEKIFIELFPHSEIGAFKLFSGVGYYAWTMILNGQKIRTKAGWDDGIICDFGLPLIEEQYYLKMSFKDKDGTIKYKIPDQSGKIHICPEVNIGGYYVSQIWSRFTGHELFNDDDLINLPFRGYTINEKKIETIKSNIVKKTFWKKLFEPFGIHGNIKTNPHS